MWKPERYVQYYTHMNHHLTTLSLRTRSWGPRRVWNHTHPQTQLVASDPLASRKSPITEPSPPPTPPVLSPLPQEAAVQLEPSPGPLTARLEPGSGLPAEGGQSHVRHPVPASRATAATRPAPPHQPPAAPSRTSTRTVGLEEGHGEEVGSCTTVKRRAICGRTRPSPSTGKRDGNKPGLLMPRSSGRLREQLGLRQADELAPGSRSFPPRGPGPLTHTDSTTQCHS